MVKKKAKISKDTEQVVETIAKEAEKAEKAAEKIMFISRIKQFGIAIGGALLFFGFLFFAVTGLIAMDKFPAVIPPEYKILICVLLTLLASLHVLGGIALIAK
jgi:hypothetical protein